MGAEGPRAIRHHKKGQHKGMTGHPQSAFVAIRSNLDTVIGNWRPTPFSLSQGLILRSASESNHVCNSAIARSMCLETEREREIEISSRGIFEG